MARDNGEQQPMRTTPPATIPKHSFTVRPDTIATGRFPVLLEDEHIGERTLRILSVNPGNDTLAPRMSFRKRLEHGAYDALNTRRTYKATFDELLAHTDATHATVQYSHTHCKACYANMHNGTRHPGQH